MTIADPAAQPPAFAARGGRRFRTVGLNGARLIVGVRGDVLEMHGEEGGQADLPAAVVERIRVGASHYQGRTFYRTAIWRRGDPAPFVLHAIEPYRDPYGTIVREFAGHVARSGGLGRIETGLSTGRVIGGLVGIGLVIGIAVFLAVLLGDDLAEPWWGLPVASAVPALLLGLWFAEIWRRERPRPVACLADLDRYLP
ncbi:hypothetical protein RCO27_10300 [Sphingosinicella sp. LHD-64]|uniref:hypothetical protein n=1 Tax=Sphingosinicella sp. LHD-64 TaxID=3072139 RepID=UPI00280CCDD3|nr:hypothetical protein [Sphingosinicella sp. LHD-64]MDQ8756623.1 hypothetical protein [Sphingosinicella sp. LHD-64]